jgi:hypothetical protein
VPTNVVVRVEYVSKNFTDRGAFGAIGARIVGGAEIPVQVTLAHERALSDPFQWDPLFNLYSLYEVRLPSLAPGAMFELLDRFETPCDPCVEHDPAPFATFTAGAGPDTQPPVLDPNSGVIASMGYHELYNSCTYTVCKGSFATWSWSAGTDDGGSVWYHVTDANSTLRAAWIAESQFDYAVSICQDCGEFGPSIYWNRFALQLGMTVRAVDNAGNLSASAVVISELPPCGFPLDAGPPDPPLSPDAPPLLDAPLADAPPMPAITSPSGSGCSVPGSSFPALPWTLALLVAAYRRLARKR